MGEVNITPKHMLIEEPQWFRLKPRNNNDGEITGEVCLKFAVTQYQTIEDEDAF